ncbi:MAG: PIN domain nuclease of toxin-antitoxin system [Lentimonas sp.]|jgi:PIN domain nuclease of toxin-antitoxin system
MPVSEGILLDTCALIWLANEPELLTEGQKEALSTSENVTISAVSSAELACLEQRGRITLDRHWKLWFDHFTTSNNIRILDVNYEILTEAYSLPAPFHRDPCDRIIVGTARHLSLEIITGDRKINDYPFVDTIL